MLRIRYGISPEWTIDAGRLDNGYATTLGQLFDHYCGIKGMGKPEKVNVKVATRSNPQGRMMNVGDRIPEDADLIEYMGVAEDKG